MVAEAEPVDIAGVFHEIFLDDPFALYRRLREEVPYYREARTGNLFLTRYADVAAVLKHPGASTAGVVESLIPVPALLRGATRPIQRILSRGMLFADPPDHTRLRSLANRAFTPRTIEGLRSRIEVLTEELLNALEGRETADLIEGFAAVLPVRVITEILGAPAANRDRIQQWSDDLTRFGGGSTDPRWLSVLRAIRSMIGVRRYLAGLIRERRARPGADLLSALVAAEEQGDSLTSEELVANALLLLVAGHETTGNLIGNGLLALLRHPEQADDLRGDPAALPGAVEEIIRYDGPIHRVARIARTEMVIGDCRIRPGQALILCPAAANRDPAQFPDADHLDVRRSDTRHLGFGHGIHFCLGAALARMETQIALGAFLRRFPRARLVDEPLRRKPNISLRGLQSLRVHLRPAGLSST